MIVESNNVFQAFHDFTSLFLSQAIKLFEYLFIALKVLKLKDFHKHLTQEFKVILAVSFQVEIFR